MGTSMAELFKNLSDDTKALNAELFEPMGISSHSQLNEALKSKRKNKYGATRVEIDGKTFDSKAEGRRYLVLKAQEEAGEISDLILQCEILLVEGFTYRGEKVRPIKYHADFVYCKDGKTYIEDTKSEITQKETAFRLRWRLLQHLYKDRDDVVLIAGD